ncbi:MAG: nicotinate-nicotinamide nucleotide adenylyltransferase, partial [Bacteroidales bacterium]|nr:nicotinate-nicotinamide nucleotide adenylyltransferase [Bacteroidales bacterium]
MHIGLYFGSFNPIHNGHLAIAQYMYTNYNFDEIWFVISPNSPFKQGKDMLNANIRLQLVQIAIENIPFLKASDIEFDMPIPSYTYRTLRKIRKLYPNNQYSIIMGGDNIDSF